MPTSYNDWQQLLIEASQFGTKTIQHNINTQWLLASVPLPVPYNSTVNTVAFYSCPWGNTCIPLFPFYSTLYITKSGAFFYLNRPDFYTAIRQCPECLEICYCTLQIPWLTLKTRVLIIRFW